MSSAGSSLSPHALELPSPWLPSIPVPFPLPRWSQSAFLLLHSPLPGLHSPPGPARALGSSGRLSEACRAPLQSILCSCCCSPLHRVRLFATPRTAACQASWSSTLSQSCSNQDHRVGDAIQPSHPLSPTSPPARNLSQHQGLFQRVLSLHQVVKVLEVQLQHQSFQ